ncbi:adenylate/guanylate cyclase domain-containing protein [Aquicella lusitana]|uniref:Adenylate cyclase n=1 Tax=Aquicella lusitana TaxID=254246 RepID=A0A370GEJ2_9COXI|nr:adenylate/guanylate cyclase domain-containing protein [Aquicella lusitana]RDI41680.1 adenylate cyclase [Aquicella lusitana]VVC72656.1 Adenylate cyclase 1 [Aquicella lusitana]
MTARLQYLKDKTTQFIVTLRFSLLFIFMTLFVITIITLFSVFYFHVSDLVMRAAYLLIDKESYAIINDLNIHLYPVEEASEFTGELVREKVLDVDDVDEMQEYLLHFLKRFALVSGVYWGDINGNFIYSRKENNGNITNIFIDQRAKPATETLLYRDKQENIVKRLTVRLNYDPRTRLWFRNALQQKKMIWTDVYVFALEPVLGVSVATPVFDRKGNALGVFGMDVRLDYLSQYVGTHKIRQLGEVFITDDEGNLIAAPQFTIDPTRYKGGLIKLSDVSEAYAAAFNAFRKSNKSMFIFESKGEDYIAAFKKIPSLAAHGWYIGVIDPETDFTRPIRELEFIYLFVDLVIFMLGIVLISGFVTRIVTPIKKLVKETEKIKHFDLSSRERVRSRIKEVVELSDAIYAMKMGLRSFQKYVPSTLVRRLIDAGEDVRVGGVKRELTVMFTDIKGFTAIAEKADSNQLVQQVCDYFEALSNVIIEDKGTIDKYIGDSIMAFWGAPVVIDDPVRHAAHAALRCLELSREMNGRWVKENKPPLITRIGIHTGDAIVGNIGSSERLNYTALGDMVNMASRLVDANKAYDTSILTTEPVYQKLKDTFVLRLVDRVRFKGKAESTAIYELLAGGAKAVSFDVEVYRCEFDQAFAAYQQQKWRDAMTHFKACLLIYPQDTLAPNFIRRCEQFKSNPPPPDWDGVWDGIEK